MIGSAQNEQRQRDQLVDRVLQQAVAPAQQVAPHVQADETIEVARPHPERGQLAQIRDDDDVAIAELRGDGVDRRLRLGRRRDDRRLDPLAVLGSVSDRAQDGQAFDQPRRQFVMGVVVVEEPDGPQPQLGHLLQDTDDLLPRRPGADHHGGHAPQSRRIRMVRTMLSPSSGSTTAKTNVNAAAPAGQSMHWPA